jgi:hypothetical protein
VAYRERSSFESGRETDHQTADLHIAPRGVDMGFEVSGWSRVGIKLIQLSSNTATHHFLSQIKGTQPFVLLRLGAKFGTQQSGSDIDELCLFRHTRTGLVKATDEVVQIFTGRQWQDFQCFKTGADISAVDEVATDASLLSYCTVYAFFLGVGDVVLGGDFGTRRKRFEITRDCWEEILADDVDDAGSVGTEVRYETIYMISRRESKLLIQFRTYSSIPRAPALR